jgi:hypothetical protein
LAPRAAASLLLEPQRFDAVELAGEVCGDRRRGVRAGVVGDDDPPAEREAVVQEGVEPADAGGERGLFVVDRYDEVEVWHEGQTRAAASGRCRRSLRGC